MTDAELRRLAEAALSCLDACATDEREPDRYREWYADAARLLRDGVVVFAHKDLLDRIDAVRAMHKPDVYPELCSYCGYTWPCPTIRLLGWCQ